MWFSILDITSINYKIKRKNKMIRKKDVMIALFLILFLNLIILINADVLIGNRSHEIGLNYGLSQKITGWINISLINEPADSLINVFDNSILLKEVLDQNSIDYTCSPLDCNSEYSVSSASSSKTFSLNPNEKKILGVKLRGQISQINSISFKVNTNAGKSCLNPIAIDLFDDSDIEYRASETSDDFSCIGGDYYGCYNPADYSGKYDITKNKICEKINLISPSKKFEIGADILKKTSDNNSVNFKLELYIGSFSKSCIVNASSSGKISCVVELSDSLSESVESDICLSTLNIADNGKYEINYENKESCGYAGNQNYDFPIFAKAAKFKEASSFVFDQNLVQGINLANKISGYILDRYYGNCDPECIIPISIIAGANQITSISNLILVYNAGSTNELYDVQKTNALIDMDYHRIDIGKAELLVPFEPGTKNLLFKIGGKEIFEEDIVVKLFNEIDDIIPHSFPALVPVNFFVLSDSKENLTYTWNFGDGSEEEITKKNTINHAYPNIGVFEIIVKMSGKTGEIIKTMSVSASSPKEYINTTIADYKKDLSNIKIQMIVLPSFVKTRVENDFNLTYLESKIKEQEANYAKASKDSEYTDIMKSLVSLKVPYMLNISRTIMPMNYLLNENQISTEVLEAAGAGSFGEGDYSKAINSWILNNLAVTFDSKAYSIYQRDGSEKIYSDVKVIIKPKKTVKEVYFIVNGNPNEIIFNGIEAKEINQAKVILFSELKEQKTIEFLYPEKINPLELPLVISTSLENLPKDVTINCNNNKKCEEGESYKNCSDCSIPWGKTLLLLGILFFIAFVIYIILQEWYKRYYESSLFKSKNDLFNLVNFMNNSENQGLKKSDILNKLKDLNWEGEHLSYAWKKLHGYRTGMWEIPIFKWVENRQVRTELEKRQGFRQDNFKPKFTPDFNQRRF